MEDALAPWDRINRFHNTTRKPIHLLVAYHADAAAASLTLTSLLKACFIPFNLHPVAEYEEAREVVRRTSSGEDTQVHGGAPAEMDELFLLVGLGAPVSLSSFFVSQRHIVVVLDSYRPFLLENIRASDGDRMVLWGHQRIRDEVNHFFRAQREREVARNRRRRRRRMVRQQRRQRAYSGVGDDELIAETGSSSDSDSDEEEEGEESSEVSPMQSQDYLDWLGGEVPEHMEKLYYAAECAGKSCALEAYDLAVLLNRAKEPVLWHAAVGVCDLFARRLIDYGTYLEEMRRLHNEVTLRKGIRRAPVDEVADDVLSSRPKSSVTSNGMQLSNIDEDQLFLLRHLSLWDAMWLHHTVASLLSLHRVDEGIGTLRQILARCGVSAKLAQQPWRELPDDVKGESRRLVHHELKQLMRTRGSFMKNPTQIRCVARTMGYSVEVSTFDVCTLFTALLAAVPPRSLATLEDNASLKGRLREFRRERFWRAYDVVDADPNSSSFTSAVWEARSLQECVSAATSALMQPGMIQSTSGIHYAQPRDPANSSTALETFGCPFRLSVLAERLLHTLTVERGLGRYSREVRPVLLSCFVPRLSGSTTEEQHKEQQGRTEEQFVVVFAHEGPASAGLSPLLPVVRWNDCVTDTEDFIVPPLRDHIRRDVVVVEGRESTAHLAEMLHLRSLSAAF
ncbi:putative CDC45 like protein [Trypanosoma vivax]|nr:putative cell division cycle 45 (CDC45) [Trypanosoma vivax]KAH8617928.1 putative CDC45 like protein [Trypanosoma vivax]